MIKFKRILVTGGLGFIGGNLIRKLLLESESYIFNIDKISSISNSENIDQLLKSNEKLKERYKFIKTDLNNFETLKKNIFDIKPDLILHLAAESHVDRSIDEPVHFIRSNIIGTFNLIEVVRKFLKKETINNFKLIHISTDEVFGSLGQTGKFSETTSYSPRSPYSASKASSDHLVRAWRHTFDLPFIITNCSNNFGPWQFPEKLIPLTILKIIRKENIPVYGNGLQIRDWLFVEDHVDALLLVAEKGLVSNDYCIGGKSEKTNLEVIRNICSIISNKYNNSEDFTKLISHVKDRPGHDSRYAINYQKIKEELGWEPKYEFEEALEKTVNWYLKNKSWCKDVLDRSNYNIERLGISV